jgi:hypothetical protein
MAAYFEPAAWSLLMLDEASEEFYYAAMIGKGCESVNALTLKTGETLARWVVDKGAPIVISDVNQDPRLQRPINERGGTVCRETFDGGVSRCSLAP